MGIIKDQLIKAEDSQYNGNNKRLRGRIFTANLGVYRDLGASTLYEVKTKFLWTTYWKNTKANISVKVIFVKNVGDYSLVMESQKHTQNDEYVSARTFSAGVQMSKAPIGGDLFDPSKYHFNIDLSVLSDIELQDLLGKSGKFDEWAKFGKIVNKQLPFEITGIAPAIGYDGAIGVHTGEKDGYNFFLVTKWNIQKNLISPETGLPYIIEAPVLPVPDYSWQGASRGGIPEGAFKGGQEPGRDLYVCRAAYQGGVHPGKLLGEYCNIGYGGAEVRIPDYEVLVVPPAVHLQWVNASSGSVPPGAIKGGQQPGCDLYVCRAAYQGGVHPGKLVGEYCNIGYGGAEVRIQEYEVLCR